MKTLIRVLLSGKKKSARKSNQAFSGMVEASQLVKMARLGQTLVVMSC